MLTELSSIDTVEFAILCLVIFIANIIIIELGFYFTDKYKKYKKNKNKKYNNY